MNLRIPREEPSLDIRPRDRDEIFYLCMERARWGGTLQDLVCVCGVMGLSGATQRKGRQDPYGAFRLREKEGSKVE